MQKTIWSVIAAIVAGLSEWHMTGGESGWTPLWAGLIGAATFALFTFVEWCRNRNKETNKAPFDMPVRDAVNHLIMTVPYSSGMPSQPNLRKQTVMKILHHYMCNGDISIWGSLDDLAPPIRIPAKKCRKLIAWITHVPQSPASPERIRFSLFGPSELGKKDGSFVEYSNLWICSSDLYRLWPKKPSNT